MSEFIIAIIIMVVFLGVGILVLNSGRKYFSKWNTLKDQESVSFNEAAHYTDEPVAVKGIIEPTDEDDVLKSPLMNEDCVAYDYKIEEKRRKRRSNGRSRTKWKTIDSGSKDTDFYINENGNKVYVDPSEAKISMESERTYNLDSKSDLPNGVVNNITSSFGSINLFGGRRKRFTEKTLEINQDGFVFGKVFQNDTKDASIRIDDDDESHFIVSDTNIEETVKRFRNKAIMSTILGIFIIGFTLMFIVEMGLD